MVLEYALGTERPVLFLDVPYKIRNENYKDLGMEPLELSIRDEAGKMVSLNELQTVPEVIEGLLVNRDKYQKRLAQIREENIFAFGHSSEIGASHILKICES